MRPQSRGGLWRGVRGPASAPEAPILASGPEYEDTKLASGLNMKLKSRLKFWSVLGRFPAKLGPKTSPDGSGSENGAERT